MVRYSLPRSTPGYQFGMDRCPSGFAGNPPWLDCRRPSLRWWASLSGPPSEQPYPLSSIRSTAMPLLDNASAIWRKGRYADAGQSQWPIISLFWGLDPVISTAAGWGGGRSEGNVRVAGQRVACRGLQADFFCPIICVGGGRIMGGRVAGDFRTGLEKQKRSR